MPRSCDETSKLNRIVRNRSQAVLRRFGQQAVSGIRNPRLLEAMADVIGYWKDWSRPALTSLSCEAVGGKPDAAENACLMFTLASSGFGIHDDIIDKSLNKHLRKTIPGLRGAENALLVGDLLITKGWAVIGEMLRSSCKPDIVAEIVEAYSKCSVEICEAEAMEHACSRSLETDLDYYKGILWKAMAETEVCTRVGAILGGGRRSEIEALSEFGRRMGFMSRLADEIEDCLNVKGDLLHRMEYESVPLPMLYASKSSNKIHMKMRRVLEKPHLTPIDAKILLKCCFETEAFEYVRAIAEQTEKKAELNLSIIELNSAREALSLFNRCSYSRVLKLCL